MPFLRITQKQFKIILNEAKERAWDEGYQRAAADHCDYWGGPEHCEITTPNPYKEAKP